MTDLRIADAPKKPTEEITGEEKLPTGGSGNYSITLESLADFTAEKKDLANNSSVDNKVGVVRDELDAHAEDLINPHQVTKGQVGLGNVDNTADADKPVSNSTQAAIVTATQNKADKSYVDNKTHSSLVDRNSSDAHTSQSISFDSSDVYTRLKQNIPPKYDQAYAISKNGYPINTELMLEDGTRVISIVSNNKQNPNDSLNGWKRPDLISNIFDIDGKSQKEINTTQLYINAEVLTPEMFKNYAGEDWTQALTDMFKACTEMPTGDSIQASLINEKLNSKNYKKIWLTKTYKTTKTIFIPPNVMIDQCFSGFFVKNSGDIGIYYEPSDSDINTPALSTYVYKKNTDGTYKLDIDQFTLPSGAEFDNGTYIQTGQRIVINGLSVSTKYNVLLGCRFVGMAGSVINYLNVGTNDSSNSYIPKVAILTSGCWNTVFNKPTTLSSVQGWVNVGSNGGMTVNSPYINRGYNASLASDITPVYSLLNYTEKGSIAITSSADAFWNQPITEGWDFPYVNSHFLRVLHPHIEGARTRNCFYFVGDTAGGDITLKANQYTDKSALSSIVYLKNCTISSSITLRGKMLGSDAVVRGENSVACLSINVDRNHFFIQSSNWGDLSLIRSIQNTWDVNTVYIDPINGNDNAIGLRDVNALKSLKNVKRLCELMNIQNAVVLNDLTYTETVDLPKNLTISGQQIIGTGSALLRVSGMGVNIQFSNTRLSHSSEGLLYLNSMTTGKIVFQCALDCTTSFIQAQNAADIDVIVKNTEMSTRSVVFGNTSYKQTVGLNIDTTATIANSLLSGNAYLKYCNLNTVSITYDPPSIAASGSLTTTVAMSATPVGTPVLASFSQYNASIKIDAVVSSANTVTVTFSNSSASAIDLVSGTLTVKKV